MARTFTSCIIVFLLIAVTPGCKKHDISSGLFRARNFRTFQIYSSSDTVILGDAAYAVTQDKDLDWAGFSFQRSNVVSGNNPFGSAPYDTYIYFTPSLSRNPKPVPGIYLFYAPSIDKVIIHRVFSPEEYWVSY